MKPKLWIGVDPGVNTGYAVWRTATQRFDVVTSAKACVVETWIAGYLPGDIHVVVEDTRKLRLPGRLQQRDAYKGLGSVHRDMQRWEEWLEHHGFRFTMAGLSPKPFRTGDDKWFKRVTDFEGRTNEHGRAAAGLVYSK